MTSTPSSADIPAETLENLVDLVGTGPVLLGAYTLAEIDAVGAIDHLFEAKPAPELIAEAVRSLAARGLISTDRGSDTLQVRGDLGIATSVQHRSRIAIDARVTGTEPDQPWRFVLMPQPEGITLEVLIDALGIHTYSLRGHEEALERLWERLPSGGAWARGRRCGHAPGQQPLHGPGHRQPVGRLRWAHEHGPRPRAGGRRLPCLRPGRAGPRHPRRDRQGRGRVAPVDRAGRVLRCPGVAFSQRSRQVWVIPRPAPAARSSAPGRLARRHRSR